VRFANINDRLHALIDGRAGDVNTLSGGRFGPDPQSVIEQWGEFHAWALEHARETPADSSLLAEFAPEQLGPPVPRPRQVFAIGLNYADHADESGFVKPEAPVVFTKFASSLTGPVSQVSLPPGSVDWEVELVVAIGAGGRNIPAAGAWRHVAGVCVGQDLSERRAQHAGPAPQFSLAKSHAGFSPIGPALVTVDELPDPDDLEIGSSIDGEVVQHARTSEMIFPVPALIESLSAVVELYPGDLIFTGTPSGVGAGRTPARFLKPGEVLRSYIAGVGELVQSFVVPDDVVTTGPRE
jgi:2,4-didehydro-3-deoxy-L-rhamnonate hydrolase